MTNRHTTVNQAIATLATITDVALADLGRRIHAAIDLDDRHPSTPDGYPSKTPGAEPRGHHPPPMAGQCRAVEAGHRCPEQRPCPEHDTTVPLTPVEAAVIHPAPPDPTTALTRAAVTNLAAAADAYQHAVRAVTELETVRRHHLELDGHCQALADVGGHEPAHRTTVLGDDNPVEITLGRWAYDFVRRHDRLPTRTETLTRMSGGRVTT